MSEEELDPLGSVSRSKLHFFWIADCSGSMRTQGKIQALNNAIHECIPSTKAANESNAFADMMVRAIRFSTGAQWHVPEATHIDDFVWQDLEAGGVTDLGAAVRLLAAELVPGPELEFWGDEWAPSQTRKPVECLRG